MLVSWSDVLKLTVPFATAVLLVWIRAWIHDLRARNAKQKALTRMIKDELETLPDAVDSLKRMAGSSREGKLRLVSFDIPGLISTYACDLSGLDTKRAYLCSDLVSSIEIVNKGLGRLSSFLIERAKVQGGNLSKRLDNVIIGQAEITASDVVSFGKSALKMMEEIPKKRRNADSQDMGNLQKKIESSKKKLARWPKIAPKKK